MTHHMTKQLSNTRSIDTFPVLDVLILFRSSAQRPLMTCLPRAKDVRRRNKRFVVVEYVMVLFQKTTQPYATFVLCARNTTSHLPCQPWANPFSLKFCVTSKQSIKGDGQALPHIMIFLLIHPPFTPTAEAFRPAWTNSLSTWLRML
jgi:hypothetical protein